MLARLKRSGCKPQGDRESHRWCRGIHHFKRVSFGLHYIAPRKAFARALCRMHARFCRVCAGAHATVGENPKYALPINIGGSGPATCSADAGSYDFDLECLVWNYHMRVWMNEKLCVCIYIYAYTIYTYVHTNIVFTIADFGRSAFGPPGGCAGADRRISWAPKSRTCAESKSRLSNSQGIWEFPNRGP